MKAQNRSHPIEPDQPGRTSRETDPGAGKHGVEHSAERSGHRGALIVFVKNADPGRVKTRLAADLGEQETLNVYLRLVAHTMEQAMGVRAVVDIAETDIAEIDIFVYFSRHVPEVWPDPTRDGFPVSESGMEIFRGASLRVQKGDDLGQRMKQAFREVFSGGYGRAAIIGSDCPELDASHLEQAFSALATHDTVAGPASDGGYYLLGMRTLHPEVFDDKAWSTDTVLRRTIQDFQRAGLRTYLLPQLRDMDDLDDYRQLKHLLTPQAPVRPKQEPHEVSKRTQPQQQMQHGKDPECPNPELSAKQVPAGSSEAFLHPHISIIIPVYNEEDGLGSFLRELGTVLGTHPPEKNSAADVPGGGKRSGEPVPYEIIVVDGGSTDRTVAVANESGVRCVISPRKGRAAQMNYGAGLASGKILYFLHADTIPPSGVLSKIAAAMEGGVRSGCFRLSFDEPSRLMRFYAWFTRFDLLPFRYGDQSLFVSADLFDRLGGYREDHVVMEDNDFFRRMRKEGSFAVLKDRVVTSARKYRENGFVRLQLIFTLIFVMYYMGFRQETLVSVYRRMIARPKL